jgi:hypothetical protein
MGEWECGEKTSVDSITEDAQTAHLNAVSKTMIYGTEISITPVLQYSVIPASRVTIREIESRVHLERNTDLGSRV